MENEISIAAISEDDSVMLFNAIGIKTYIQKSIPEIERIIFDLVNHQCKIIYVSESIYERIPETLDKYKDSPFPMIIPIPIDNNPTGIGLRKIKKNVEKAVGIDIL